MKWFVAAILLLFVAMVLNLTLLVYALFIIIAILFASKWVTSLWTQAIEAERVCEIQTSKIGELVPVIIKLKHVGRFPITWLLVEDMLENRSLVFNPPSLGVKGNRLAATGTGTYSLRLMPAGSYTTSHWTAIPSSPATVWTSGPS